MDRTELVANTSRDVLNVRDEGANVELASSFHVAFERGLELIAKLSGDILPQFAKPRRAPIAEISLQLHDVVLLE